MMKEEHALAVIMVIKSSINFVLHIRKRSFLIQDAKLGIGQITNVLNVLQDGFLTTMVNAYRLMISVHLMALLAVVHNAIKVTI